MTKSIGAGNPHVRFYEGKAASAMPKRGSLLRACHKATCSVLVAIVAFCSDLTAADYSVVVGADNTNVVDAAFIAALGSANRLVKTGPGTLKSNSLMSSYAGEIVVEEGVLLVDETGALGTSAGKTTVSNGASIVFKATNANNAKFYGETIQIAGDGAEGVGGAFANLGVSLTGQNFRYITLLDDARIYAYGEMSLYAGVLEMNGHTLYMAVRNKDATGATSWSYGFTMNRSRVRTPGHIVLETGRFCISGRTLSDGTAVWDGDETNTFTIKSRAKLNFASSLTKVPWKLIAEDISGLYVNGDVNANALTNNARGGPVELRGSVSISYRDSQEGNMVIAGPVTGTGPLTWDNYTTLHLYGTNTFTGGVSCSGLGKYGYTPLYLHDGRALPAAGGNLKLVNADLPLVAGNPYSLPRLAISNDTVRTISGAAGGGTIAGIVKSGTGTLIYNAKTIVTGRTEVLQGTFRLGSVVEPRAQVGGILEGECNFESDSYSYPGANYYWGNLSKTYPAVSTIMDSIHYAYTNAQPLWASQHAMARYEGYIWNDSLTDETWTFMSGCQNRGRMYINDTRLFDQNSYQRAAFAQATLKPGANHFVYSIFFAPTTTGGGGGSTLTDIIDFDGTLRTNAEDLNWVKFKGCAFNRYGKKSYDEADYEKFENLSDGLLMTVTNDLSGLVPHPIGGFSNLVVAAGAVFDVGRRDVVLPADVFAGEGTVSNGILNIGSRWTIRLSELSKGNALSLKSADLTFDADAVVDVDDMSALSRSMSPCVIAVSDAVMTTLPKVSDRLSAARWRVELGDGGQSFVLCYAPRGMVVNFR